MIIEKTQMSLGRKFAYALSAFVVVLIILRLIAPGIILNKMNDYLGSFSPLYELHIQDLGLRFYRMAYTFDGVEGRLKKEGPKEKFLTVEKIDVSLAWRELIRLKFVADVKIKGANFKVTTASIDALSGKGDQVKQDAKNVKDATVPFNLESLQITDSTFIFSDVAGLQPEEDFRMTHVEIMANNLTPANKSGLSIYTATGDVQDNAKLKAVGQLRPNHDPFEWSVNLELKDFTLSKLNPIARRMVPITFKSGTLSLYCAAQSVDGKLLGYIKPFLKDVVFIGDKGDFKNVGQVFIELGSTIGNWFLKNGKTHSLATKIAFKTGPDGKMQMDTGKALKVAVDNKFGDALPQKIDETLDLK